MPEEFSPEEKLLRLIRGDKKQKDKPVPENVEVAKVPEGTPAIPTSAPIKDIKYEAQASQAAGGDWKYFKFINLALIAILIITIGFFIFDIVSSKLEQPIPALPYPSTQELPPQVAGPQGAGQTPTPPFSTYSETIGKRELFKPLQSEVIKTEKPAEMKAELAFEKIKDLSLIGIIAGEKPQAVVEDKKHQKTYFLYKGQTINQLKVEEILEDRIILDFDGEKLELSL